MSCRRADDGTGTRFSVLDALLLVLTATAASTDAISYLALGQVFPANMTGNTVLLGIGIAEADYGAAGRSAVALGGFLVGAAIAGAVHYGRSRATMLVRGLIAELAVLAAACGWRLAVGDHPVFATQHGLIGLVSVAMGMQSATITRLDVGVSTVFITGTWTAVSSRVGSWLRRPRDPGQPTRAPDKQAARQTLVVVVYLAAALGSAFAQHAAGAVAAVIPLVLLATACAGTAARVRITSRRR